MPDSPTLHISLHPTEKAFCFLGSEEECEQCNHHSLFGTRRGTAEGLTRTLWGYRSKRTDWDPTLGPPLTPGIKTCRLLHNLFFRWSGAPLLKIVDPKHPSKARDIFSLNVLWTTQAKLDRRRTSHEGMW
ncbi:hypothetical protein Ddc_07236 [Ditylenchus destructor]|nr:hypothetical protein Ddc_07236 [Ditylenchus destructor]